MGFVYWRVTDDEPGRRLRLERSDDPRRAQQWERRELVLRSPRLAGLVMRERVIAVDAMRTVSWTVFPAGRGPYLIMVDVDGPPARPLRGAMILKGVEAPEAALEVLFKIARIGGWGLYRVTPAHADGWRVELVREAADASHPYRVPGLLEAGPPRPIPPLPPLEHPLRPAASRRFSEPTFEVDGVEEGWRLGDWRLALWNPPRSVLLVQHPPGLWRWLGRFVRPFSRHASYRAHFDIAGGRFSFRSGHDRTVVPLEDLKQLRLRREGTAKYERWSLEVVREVGRVAIADTGPGARDEAGHARALALMIALARALDLPWEIAT